MKKKILYGVLIVFGLFILIAIAAPDTSQNTVSNVQPQIEEKTDIATTTPQATTTSVVSGSNATILYSVVKVIDGDTVDVNVNGKAERLRLIGINTPETVDPRKSVECFGTEASNKAKQLLTNAKVRLEADPSQGERDKYGRLLRYIFLEDGKHFNRIMISEGYASEYTYNLPYKYQAEFKQAENEARAAKRGLWADNACKTATQPATQPAVQNPKPTTNTSQPSTSYADKDCSDFKTQAEAQAYFDSRGGSASNNVDRLDGSDKDGKVCESLP